jgi:hypothetical protein
MLPGNARETKGLLSGGFYGIPNGLSNSLLDIR